MGGSGLKYSVNDINYMRELLRFTIQYHPYVEGWQYWYSGVDSDVLETRLQTHMMNGTRPKEIRKILKKRMKRAQAEVDRLVDLGHPESSKDIESTMDQLKFDLRDLDAIYRNQ